VLGHDLTALGLQLEIASHLAPTTASPHVDKARQVSARLLCNLRQVVSATRTTPGSGLAEALRALVADLPGLRVHLTVADGLCVEQPERAHCVLRCVQEIVTNALRHAQARNLWITVSCGGGEVTVDARDDGRGAEGVAAGAGLSGMRARIEELGGVLRIAPAPSFALHAALPAQVAP
jgi:signal transduction histidine kinase